MINKLVILIIVGLILSCDSEKSIVSYYLKNKETTLALHDAYKKFERELPINDASLTNYYWSDYIELHLRFPTNSAELFLFDKETLELISYQSTPSFVDSLQKSNYKIIENALLGKDYKDLLEKFSKSEYRAISVEEDYFFVTLGDHPKDWSSDTVVGLLFTTNYEYSKHKNFVRTVEPNVFLVKWVVR